MSPPLLLLLFLLLLSPGILAFRAFPRGHSPTTTGAPCHRALPRRTAFTAPDDLVRALEWRYATKAFDASQAVPAETWAALEAALVLTPSSFGLQPWKFVTVDDPALREALLPLSYGQRQVVDAPHLVVFAGRTEMTEGDVDAYFAQLAEDRGLAADPAKAAQDLSGYRAMVTGAIVHGMSPEEQRAWAVKQVYIALGQFMAAAALLGVDACPLEGIQPAAYDEVLGLHRSGGGDGGDGDGGDSGFATAVAIAVGYRSPDDSYAGLAKTRFPAAKLFLRK